MNVIGEIGGAARPPAHGDALLLENGTKIPILPRGSLIRPFEWVIGYARLQSGGYLAVVYSMLTPFRLRPARENKEI